MLVSLLEHKLPAMDQAGFTTDKAEIVLASKSGFTDGARALALEYPRVALWDAADLLR